MLSQPHSHTAYIWCPHSVGMSANNQSATRLQLPLSTRTHTHSLWVRSESCEAHISPIGRRPDQVSVSPPHPEPHIGPHCATHLVHVLIVQLVTTKVSGDKRLQGGTHHCHPDGDSQGVRIVQLVTTRVSGDERLQGTRTTGLTLLE